jgi:hypothetical protein
MKLGENIASFGSLTHEPGGRSNPSAVTNLIGPVGSASRKSAIDCTSNWLTTIASARSALVSASAPFCGDASSVSTVGPLRATYSIGGAGGFAGRLGGRSGVFFLFGGLRDEDGRGGSKEEQRAEAGEPVGE